LAVAYSGILAAAFSNIIVFNGVRLLGPTRVITLQSFVPAMAVVMAYFFLGEPIRPAQIVGGLIIVLGVALTRWASMRPAAAVTAARGEPTDVRPPVPPLRDGELPLSILIDYDGTISLTDVTDVVMAEHLPGNWEESAALYDAGKIGSRSQMVWELEEFDTESELLFATAAAQPHDPGFVPFIRRAQAASIPWRSCRTGSASSSGPPRAARCRGG
jgi:hypothetical protein